jgi:hypothetical protein
MGVNSMRSVASLLVGLVLCSLVACEQVPRSESPRTVVQGLASLSAEVDLTPSTGRTVSGSFWYWAVKGYRVRFAQDTVVSSIEARMELAEGSCAEAVIHDVETRTELARGASVCGGRGDTFYRSAISFNVVADREYILSFYVPASTTTPFTRQEDMSFPYTVGEGLEVLQTVSTSTTTFGYPGTENYWAPHMRVVLGTGATVQVSPTELAFGNQRVGTSSATRAVTVSNTGVSPLNLTALTVTGPFVVSGLPVPATVAPGGSATFEVTFMPSAPEAVSGRVVVESDATNGTQTVVLSGTGVQPVIAVSPPTLDFGDTLVGTASEGRGVIVSNIGTDLLVLSEASVSGPFRFEQSLPVSVAPGESLALSVSFVPTAPGVASGSLRLTSDAPGSPSTVELSGRGVVQRATVTHTSLDLGSVNVGRTSTAQTVTLSNASDTGLVLTGVSLSGAAAGDFATDASPLELPPGASYSFQVTFSPSAVGARAARLTLQLDDPVTPGIEVALSGVGSSPALELSAASLDFGGVRLGKSSGARTLTVKNTGTGPLTLTSASLSGTSASRFSLADVSSPRVIPAGGSTDLAVTFHPNTVGVASAELTLLSDDAARANVVVPLTGIGISPRLVLYATALDFGAQWVGHTSPPRSFTVTNTGSATLTLSRVGVEGSGSAAFALAEPPELPLVLAPGQGTTLRVTMTKEDVGVSEAAVLLESDDVESPRARVALRGTGVSRLFSVSVAELSFGTFRLPARSSPRSVVITNLTAEPLELAEPELMGPHASHFRLSGGAASLEPGASTEVTVVYETSAAADSRAILRMATRDGASAFAVALSGRALSKLVRMEPASLDFDVVEEGTTSPARTVTLINLSTEPLVVSGLQSDDEAFTIDASGLSSPLAPGTGGTFTVTFSPKVVGPASGQVRVMLQGASEPEAVVDVSGTGRARDVTTEPPPGCGCGQGPGGSPWSAGLMLALTLGWLRRTRRRGV